MEEQLHEDSSVDSSAGGTRVARREPQETIPRTQLERERMKLQARAYVEAHRPVPPLSFEELRKHADVFTNLHRIDAKFRDYAAVLLSSEVWRDSLAAVPV